MKTQGAGNQNFGGVEQKGKNRIHLFLVCFYRVNRVNTSRKYTTKLIYPASRLTDFNSVPTNTKLATSPPEGEAKIRKPLPHPMSFERKNCLFENLVLF